MEIRVDGSRSTNENWLRAATVSSQELPEITKEERAVADTLGISHESYARSRYAGDLSAAEWKQRAERLGHYIQGWLSEQKLDGSVILVGLTTFTGKYSVDVELRGRHVSIRTEESLIDRMFEGGSHQAERDLIHVLELNLLRAPVARAS